MAELDKAIGKDDILVMATHKIALLERFTRIIMMVGGQITRDGPANVILDEMRKASQPPGGRVTSSIRAGGTS